MIVSEVLALGAARGGRAAVAPAGGGYEHVRQVLQQRDLLAAVCAAVHAGCPEAGGALEGRKRARRLKRELPRRLDCEAGGPRGACVAAVPGLDEPHRHRKHKREGLAGACRRLRRRVRLSTCAACFALT